MIRTLVPTIEQRRTKRTGLPYRLGIFSIIWLPGLCFAGSASGADLLKYWIHFSIFIIVMVYLWKKKISKSLISWGDKVNETISKNTQLLNEALESKSEIERKLANIQSEIERIIQEAHQTGKSRRESFLNQLKEEIKLRLRYKEQLESELKRSLNESFRSYVMAKSRELVLNQLSRTSADEQIKFFERKVFEVNLYQNSSSS